MSYQPQDPYARTIEDVYEPTQPQMAPPPNPYSAYGAYPAYGGYNAYSYARPHPQATTIMVLGILGLVQVPILPFVAFFMGRSAKREIAASNGYYTEDGQLKAGYICGLIGMIVHLTLGGLYVLMLLLSFGLATL